MQERFVTFYADNAYQQLQIIWVETYHRNTLNCTACNCKFIEEDRTVILQTFPTLLPTKKGWFFFQKAFDPPPLLFGKICCKLWRWNQWQQPVGRILDHSTSGRWNAKIYIVFQYLLKNLKIFNKSICQNKLKLFNKNININKLFCKRVSEGLLDSA